MSKLYRFEIETLWIHPENNLTRRREMVYDFTTDTLIADERTHSDGQEFYDPKRSPHIYADWDKAELAYTNLDWLHEEWKPLADLMYEGSHEHIEAFRLIAVNEDGKNEVVAENNYLADLITINEAYQRQLQTA